MEVVSFNEMKSVLTLFLFHLRCFHRENFLTEANIIWRGGRPRWKRRKILNSPPPPDTLNRTISSEKDLKTSCAGASCLQTRKEPHQSEQERLSRGTAVNPTPGQRPAILMGTHKARASPWGERGSYPIFKTYCWETNLLNIWLWKLTRLTSTRLEVL